MTQNALCPLFVFLKLNEKIKEKNWVRLLSLEVEFFVLLLFSCFPCSKREERNYIKSVNILLVCRSMMESRMGKVKASGIVSQCLSTKISMRINFCFQIVRILFCENESVSCLSSSEEARIERKQSQLLFIEVNKYLWMFIFYWVCQNCFPKCFYD